MTTDVKDTLNLTVPAQSNDGHDLDDHDHHDYAGDTIFGFWIYILSDCLLFGTLFAVYAVYSNSFAGLIEPKELFNLSFVLAETALLDRKSVV